MESKLVHLENRIFKVLQYRDNTTTINIITEHSKLTDTLLKCLFSELELTGHDSFKRVVTSTNSTCFDGN